ncbi:MAG: A24 family peptidase [Nanoarchaeota archaeon]|nr:A24 family peptidase [Nanoarchaeota archaeon]MBU1005698.1 A24 family peptidase [Nanoarchaeota archaeon]MBU1946411.1 A24 family peptidase [Nanoarchaeota archaeon]
MAYLIITLLIVLAGLVIGSITDFKKREVPDWLSYGMIFAGIGLSGLFSAVYWDYWFFLNSLIGFLVFLIIALVMFYTGQWGGGDSKVLMGMGALIGLDIRFLKMHFLISNGVYEITQMGNIPNFLIAFFINMLFAGAVYGLIWSVFLIFKNRKGFYKEFKKVRGRVEYVRIRNYLLVSLAVIIVLFLFNISNLFISSVLLFFVFLFALFYMYICVKAVEKKCMIKPVTPDKLTEGDWIVKDIKYKGKYICGPKDLGIEKKQIKELLKLYRQNKIKNVLVKEGIPFVPSFLIAYIVTLVWGNLIGLLFV